MFPFSDQLGSTLPLKKDEMHSNKLFYVDLIRTYAIIMVVLVHVSGPAMLRFSSISKSSWWISNILFSFAHQGVPLFIFLSGLLLLDPAKNESTVIFFRKRMGKVFWPFLFWSVFYYLWRVYVKGDPLTINQAVALFVKGPMYYHLWFIYLIIGLYLATPILRFYMENAPIGNILYFVVVWVVFNSFHPFFTQFTGLRLGISNVLFHSMLGYYLLGALLKEVKFSSKYNWLILIIVAMATLCTAMGTHLLTLGADGQYQNTLIRLHMPNIIVISLGMFLLLVKWHHADFFNNKYIAALIRRIAVSSFGIYLLHPVIIELLDAGWFGFPLHAMSIHPVVGIPTTVMATVIISFMAVMLLRRIPVLRSVVP